MKKYRITKTFQDGGEIQEMISFGYWETPNQMNTKISEIQEGENCQIRIWQKEAFDIGMCPLKYDRLFGWNRI